MAYVLFYFEQAAIIEKPLISIDHGLQEFLGFDSLAIPAI